MVLGACFALDGPFLLSWLLPGHSAPAWPLGALKTNRHPLGCLVISRTAGVLPDDRRPTSSLLLSWLFSALFYQWRFPDYSALSTQQVDFLNDQRTVSDSWLSRLAVTILATQLSLGTWRAPGHGVPWISAASPVTWCFPGHLTPAWLHNYRWK